VVSTPSVQSGQMKIPRVASPESGHEALEITGGGIRALDCLHRWPVAQARRADGLENSPEHSKPNDGESERVLSGPRARENSGGCSTTRRPTRRQGTEVAEDRSRIYQLIGSTPIGVQSSQRTGQDGRLRPKPSIMGVVGD